MGKHRKPDTENEAALRRVAPIGKSSKRDAARALKDAANIDAAYEKAQENSSSSRWKLW